ncbi:MAG: hypothetical protein MH252_02015 [Thermosynechococcaceae cyanobacterium MS004]|nr:hypothetical protein [Thermosynechococcaceae cyanobacterium MS004]
MPTLSLQIPRADIVSQLYPLLANQTCNLVELTWEQHLFHEQRSWSAVSLLQSVNLDALSPIDKANIWNAGRAELTTKPGADRLAHLADAECRRWQDTNPALASVLQACSTWSRYWNEEESFHETTLNHLAHQLGFEPVSDESFLEFRKIFPNDDMLRTLVLLAISEITAMVNYSTCAQLAQDPGLRKLFKQIASDEAQHLSYFISFAKALVDSGEYSPKGAFAITHFFLREDGELQGSQRQKKEQRNTHVNWWDALEYDWDQVPNNLARKQGIIFSVLRQITGIAVHSVNEVEQTWMDLVGC